LTIKYSNNCQSGCVIPITFNSFADQNINLSSFQLLAGTIAGSQVFNKIYNVTRTPATLSTKGSQSISLNNAGLMVSGTPGNSTFTLILYDGSTNYTILSKMLSIGQIPQVSNIVPRTTAATVATNFSAIVNTFGYNTSIVSYQWNFGDGSALQTTTTGIVSHVFSQVKAYNIQVTISTAQGLVSSANFTVDVIAPKDAVSQILTKDIISLSNIQSQMSGYTGFTQNAVSKLLNLNSINTSLNNIIIKNSTASTDSDYLSMMNALVQISLPDGIELSSSAAGAPFVPFSDSINLDALQRIGGGTYDTTRKSDYVNSIIGWDLNNMSMTIDYNDFSAIYGTETNHLGGVYKLNILGGGKPLSKVYLFIPDLDGIQLDKNYTKMGDYYYVPLNGSPQTVQFSTTQQLSLVQLPIFISPSLSQISIPDTTDKPEPNRTWILVVIFGGIIVVGILGYIFIGKWYKDRYESYLFKDKNDLYNIINYIHSAKSRGVKEEDIEKNLRKSTWTSEQVSYIMKRYAGKSVGFLGFKKDNIKK
jgi:PKD domain